MAWKDNIPIIGDALNFIGGLWSNHQNAKENQKNREWSEKMWHLNNEYNLPVNQIQRFQDAGLNPALAYGEGTSSLSSYAGNMSASRGYENPAKFDTAQIAQLKINRDIADSQIKLNESEELLKTEQAKQLANENAYKPRLMSLELKEKGIDIDTKELDYAFNVQTLNSRVATILTQLEVLATQKEYNEQEVLKAKQEVENLKEILNNLKKEGVKIEEETKLVQAEQATEQTKQEANRAAARLSGAEAIKALEQAKTEKFTRSKLSSDVLLNKANIEYMRKNGAKTDEEAKKIIMDTYNAWKNGQLERTLKGGPQRYGNGTIGAAAGIIIDELGFKPGSEPIGTHVKKQVFKKLGGNPFESANQYIKRKTSYFNKSKRR